MFMHRIKLKNMLSFGPDAQDLELKPLNVLIGPNGSGKSNFIEAISLLQAAPRDLQKPIREGGGVGNWVWRGEPRETFAEMEVVISHQVGKLLRYKLVFYEVDQRFQLHSELLCPKVDSDPNPIPYVEADACRVDLLYDDSRQETGMSTIRIARPPLAIHRDSSSQETGMSTIRIERARSNQSVFAYIRGPTYHELTQTGEQFQRISFYREWAFGRRSPLRSPQPVDLPNDFLMEDGKNLGLVLNRMKRAYPKDKDRLLSGLRQLYENIEDLDVSVDGGTVQVFLREGNITVPATRLSDGTLRYICLLAILCHPTPPPLVCLEEPELGLHPDVLPGMADLLRNASARCQLIVTTHSDVIIDALTDTPESVVVCEKKAGQTVLQRLNESDLARWLDQYRLGELWTSGELGGNRW